jgi:DNA-directed RNA polymerase subunit M/transcription elongation factor TFIIS
MKKCEHCGSAMITRDSFYNYYRCLMCGRPADYTRRLGHDSLKSELSVANIQAKRKEMGMENGDIRLEECTVCGALFKAGRHTRVSYCKHCSGVKSWDMRQKREAVGL